MRRFTLLLLATWLFVQPAALAMEFRSGDDVVIPAGTVIDDDLYVAGRDVRIEGTVTGDLVVAGGDVTITGDVRQDLIAAGGDLTLRGRVGQSIRAAGGTLKLSGTVGRDVLLAGGDISQESDAKVAGDGAYAGGNVTIAGRVGEAMIAGGDVTLRGTMGPTNIQAGELTVEEATRLNGPLVYTSTSTADIATGAVITGGVTHHAKPARKPGVPGSRWAWWAAMILASLLSATVLSLLLPKAAERVTSEIERQPLVALLIGFAIVVGLPIALLFLAITVVGIPLAVTLFGLYVLTWHVGWLASGLALGDFILSRRFTFKSLRSRLLAAVALGIPLLLLLQVIPFIGWLIAFLAVCVGFGGIALAVVGRRPLEAQSAASPVEA